MGNGIRPCYVYNRKHEKIKALFLGWSTESTMGARQGDVILYTNALIELQNGMVMKVNPTDIVFADDIFNEHTWCAKEETTK